MFKDKNKVTFQPPLSPSSSLTPLLKSLSSSFFQSKLIISGHHSDINNLCFSPDGSKLVSCSNDGNLIVRETETFNELFRIIDNFRIYCFAISPDGSTIALSFDSNSVISLFSLQTGAQIRNLTDSGDTIQLLLFSKDGKKLYSNGIGSNILEWELQTGNSKIIIKSGFETSLHCILLSPLGKELICSSEESFFKLFNIETGDLIKIFEGHNSRINCLAYNSNGLNIASGGNDNTIRIWNKTKGNEISILKGHDSLVLSIKYSNDDNFLISGGYDNNLIIWNVNTNEIVKKISKVHESAIKIISINLDGEIASAGIEGEIKILDLQKGSVKKTISEFPSLENYSINEDGSKMCTIHKNGTIKLFNCYNGEEIWKINHQGKVVCFDKESEFLISNGENGIYIWSLDDGKLINKLDEEKIFSIISVKDKNFVYFTKNNLIRRNLLKGEILKKKEFGVEIKKIICESNTIAILLVDKSIIIVDQISLDKKIIIKTKGESLDLTLSKNGLNLGVIEDFKNICIYNIERNELITSIVNDSHLTNIHFLDDEKTIVTFSSDSLLKLWDIETSGLIHSIAFKSNQLKEIFSSNNQKFLVCGEERHIKIFEILPNNENIIIRGISSKIKCISFCSDNNILACNQNTIGFWNPLNGHQLKKSDLSNINSKKIFINPYKNLLLANDIDEAISIWKIDQSKNYSLKLTGKLKAGCFSSDSKHIAISCYENTIRFFPIDRPLDIKELKGHEDIINSILFNKNDNLLFASSKDKSISVWNLNNFALKSKYLGHTESVKKIALSLNNNYLISSSLDQTIRVWNIETDDCLFIIDVKDSNIKCLSFINNDQLIIAGTQQKQLKTWAFPSCKPIINPQNSKLYHDDSIISISPSLNGKLFISASKDGVIIIWDSTNGEKIRKISNHKGISQILTKNSNGLSNFATLNDDNTLRIWSSEQNEEINSFIFHDFTITCICMSSDNSKIAIGNDIKTIQIFSTINNELLATLKGHQNTIRSISFDKTSKYLVSGSNDKTIKLWNNESEIQKINGHNDYVIQVMFISDDQNIVSCSEDKTIRIWNKAGKELIKINDDVSSFVISPNGLKIVGICERKKIKIWNAINGMEEKNIIQQDIDCIAFHPIYNDIVAFSEKKIIKIINIETKIIINEIKGHEDNIQNINFTSNGNSIISCGNDFSIRIWKKCFNINDFLFVNFCLNIVTNSKNLSECLSNSNKKFIKFITNYILFVPKNRFSIWHLFAYLQRYNDFIVLLEKCLHNKDFENSELLDHNELTPLNLIIKEVKKKKNVDRENLIRIINFYLKDMKKLPIGQFLYKTDFFNVLISQLSMTESVQEILDQRLFDTKEIGKLSSNYSLTTCENISGKQRKIERRYSDIILGSPILQMIRNLIFQTNYTGSQFKILDIPDICKISKENTEFLENIIKNGENCQLLNSETINFLIEYKWAMFGNIWLFYDIIKFVILLILFTTNSVYLVPKYLNENIPNSGIESAFLNISITLLVYVSFLMILEFKKCIMIGIKTFVSNFWNLIHFSVLSLIFASSIIDILFFIGNYDKKNALKNLHAIALILNWSRFSNFFIYFQDFHLILIFIQKVMKEGFAFILIFFWFILGFGFSIHVLKNTSDSDVFSTFQAIYELIYGDFYRFEFLYDISNNDVLLWVFFLAATLLLIIIITNFLIGFSLNNYQIIFKNKKQTLLYYKIIYLIELEKASTKYEINNLNSQIKSFLLVEISNKYKALSQENSYLKDQNLKSIMHNNEINELFNKHFTKIEDLIKNSYEQNKLHNHLI